LRLDTYGHNFNLDFIHHSYADLLEYFPEYDYHCPKENCIPLLQYSHPQNIVGAQQRCFNYFWALHTIWMTGNLAVEVGSHGVKTPYCVATDIYDSPGVELIVDGRELPFCDNSIHLLLANHVIEHIPGKIPEILSHWVSKVAIGGLIALVCPDQKYSDVLKMNTEGYTPHIHAVDSRTFRTHYLTATNIEVVEYDFFKNGFSFNVVLRKLH